MSRKVCDAWNVKKAAINKKERIHTRSNLVKCQEENKKDFLEEG